MTRRCASAGVALLVLGVGGALCAQTKPIVKGGRPAVDLKLLPYPQQVHVRSGRLPLGPARCETARAQSPTERLAADSLTRYLPRTGPPIAVRLGSVEEGYAEAWLSDDDRAFLARGSTSPEAYVLDLGPKGITIVGKGKWGMLYGVQTINQLALQAAQEASGSLPCVSVRDWPDMKWRCLSPALTWYSGFNRLEGYDLCNWSLDEWKWLVDWSLLHKCNAWAVCMCGYWPFTMEEYPEAVLDVDSFFFNPKTGRKEPWRFVHPNIRHEFYPEVIRYAQQRGIKVYAYTAINSFVGGYLLHHPDANAGGAAELIPFHPGVHEYVDAFLGRMVEMGFDGFVWENPESYHVPNQNAQCYDTFWKPWAEKYGFSSVTQTDQNAPPLGVHVEYLAWLFNEYNNSVQAHARRLGLPPRETYLISHFLLSRIMAESKSQAEAKEWLDLLDRNQGCKVQWIVSEAREKDYVRLLGGDRVANLGGRGGSCTCAMRRIASINNNWSGGPMGTGVDWERDCQRHIYEAGGRGAMGYIFEWRLNEIFGYIAAQYLWRSEGVPAINNEDQVGFLDYAYRLHFGDRVGALVARALDGGSNVNEAMILDGVHGSQYPETGKPLYRDHQLLAAQADEAARLAWKAYREFAGSDPDLHHALYESDRFRWAGYDAKADHLFKAETLRRLCVSTRRSQKMCEAALAYGLAMKLAAQGAQLRLILGEMDRAVADAEENQLLYQLNYDDDYDWTDGLCVKLTERLRQVRESLELAASGGGKVALGWTFATPGDLQGWTSVYDLTPPVIEGGALQVRAMGVDPQIVHPEALALPITARHFVRLEMSSDKAGRAELFWTDKRPGDAPWNPTDFGQHTPVAFDARVGAEPTVYVLSPPWEGTLTGLRLDTPDGATVRIRGIEVRERPEGDLRPTLDLAKPAPDAVRRMADRPLMIPWQKQTDLPPPAAKSPSPGLYLSLNLGLNTSRDTYCQGVVFAVEAQAPDGGWRTILRRTLGKNSHGWEHWDVPLPGRPTRLRFLTDSYSRAQDRSWPSWRWALWGRPELIEVARNGERRVVYDFVDHLAEAHPFVRLDADGADRPFDGKGEDSTGATFELVQPSPAEALLHGEGRDWQGVEGFASAVEGAHSHAGEYRCYLGNLPSWWGYADEGGVVEWTTAPLPVQKDSAIAFVAGTDYTPGKAELWCDGRRLLGFETGKSADARWQEGDVELRYFHGGDTRDERTPYGLSGLYLLRLPARRVTPNKPLNLSVKMLSGGHAWFMIHGCRDAIHAGKLATPPDTSVPCIAAFTPRRAGAFGVTGAEYEVPQR